MKTRIMFIERKTGAGRGSARIGRVTFNRTGRSIRYDDKILRRIVGGGVSSSNYIEESNVTLNTHDDAMRCRATAPVAV
jgi:hypothetical protein